MSLWIFYPACACVCGVTAYALLEFDQVFATIVAVAAIVILGLIAWAALTRGEPRRRPVSQRRKKEQT